MVPFHFEFRGTRYPASYRIDGRFVEVSTPYGTHRAVIGLAVPHKLARAILRSLVQKHADAQTPSVDLESPRIARATRDAPCTHAGASQGR